MEEGVEGSGGGGLGRKIPAGEVELKEKSGTAWSHSFLNQKPWHPLSYPNQRRKWIAEQIHTNRARRDEEVQREFAQEQEFFRQTALFNKKDKEKVCTYTRCPLVSCTCVSCSYTSLNYYDRQP
jgi:CBF1 interacting corepressor